MKVKANRRQIQNFGKILKKYKVIENYDYIKVPKQEGLWGKIPSLDASLAFEVNQFS